MTFTLIIVCSSNIVRVQGGELRFIDLSTGGLTVQCQQYQYYQEDCTKLWPVHWILCDLATLSKLTTDKQK